MKTIVIIAIILLFAYPFMNELAELLTILKMAAEVNHAG